MGLRQEAMKKSKNTKMQVRIDPILHEPLKKQADENRRSVAAEVNYVMWCVLGRPKP
jgi:hypothetical protein